MRKLIVLLVMFSASLGFAAGTPENPDKKKATNVSFDDLLVQGKYQFADDMVTTVEDDKILDALLSVRKDFKDRIKRSAAKH